MPLGVVRDLRSPRVLETHDDAKDYQEHLLAEYVFARAAHGVLDSTIRQDVASIEEFLEENRSPAFGSTNSILRMTGSLSREGRGLSIP